MIRDWSLMNRDLHLTIRDWSLGYQGLISDDQGLVTDDQRLVCLPLYSHIFIYFKNEYIKVFLWPRECYEHQPQQTGAARSPKHITTIQHNATFYATISKWERQSGWPEWPFCSQMENAVWIFNIYSSFVVKLSTQKCFLMTPEFNHNVYKVK